MEEHSIGKDKVGGRTQSKSAYTNGSPIIYLLLSEQCLHRSHQPVAQPLVRSSTSQSHRRPTTHGSLPQIAENKEMKEYNFTHMEDNFYQDSCIDNGMFSSNHGDDTLGRLQMRDKHFATSLGKITRVERLLDLQVPKRSIPDPRYNVRFSRHKSLKGFRSARHEGDLTQPPAVMLSTENIFKQSQKTINKRISNSRSHNQNEELLSEEGSIVLNMDHGLYSPPQLSNNVQSVMIIQSP